MSESEGVNVDVAAGNVLSNISVELDAVGKAVEPLTTTFARLMENLLGPATEEGGKNLGEFVRAFNKQNVSTFFRGFREKCRLQGVDATRVPPSFLVPIVEGVRNVNDPDLQDLWQQLGVNAASSEDCQRAIFFETVKNITPDDKRVFDTFVGQGKDQWFEVPDAQTRTIQSLPRLEALGLVEPIYNGSVEQRPATGRIVQVTDQRSGQKFDTLLNPPVHGQVSPLRVYVRRGAWRVTAFGWQFYAAVTKPMPAASPTDPPQV